MILMQQLTACQTGAGDSMAKGLGLGLSTWRSNQGSLCFCGGSRGRKKRNLLADGAAKVLECLLNIRWVVVGFVRVLRASAATVRERMMRGTKDVDRRE